MERHPLSHRFVRGLTPLPIPRVVIRPRFYYPATIAGYFVARGDVQMRWWLFAMPDWTRDCYVTPRSRVWWYQVKWRFVLRPFFRALMRLGMWQIEEGGRYWQDGRAPWMHGGVFV